MIYDTSFTFLKGFEIIANLCFSLNIFSRVDKYVLERLKKKKQSFIIT